MVRRLLAFALAFVVIGAPLASDACGAFCASHAGHAVDPTVPVSRHHSSTGASHAAHHHHADAPRVPISATDTAALRPVAHQCEQADAVIADSRELTNAPIAGAAATVARLTSALGRALPPPDADGRHGPPAPIRSISPLRI